MQTLSAQPPPSPPPPPPPPPPPTNFDTAEFRRSDGPGFHGADAAWRDGATGEGQIIAVIDTGIDSDSGEFAGRIHPNSRDVAGNRGLDPEDDHGTNVALIAAAARDDIGVLGTAFDAQLLAIRADMPGSCGADTPQDASLGCLFTDTAIAQGIDLAIQTGASVINLSLGGSEASPSLLAAVERAADAGVVLVVAAGNGGNSSDASSDPAQPDPFATSLLAAGGSNVIIVGSVNVNGDFSAFSNRAGSAATSFISARGERICCVYEDGELFVETINGQDFLTLFSGTSFAAPQVAGAAALLAQAFPNLSGEEIVSILLDSARDVGSTGVDATFGTGILDIAAAFQPKGTTSIAGTSKQLVLGDDFAVASPAMGDAFAGATLNTIITDRYDRAYEVDLAREARGVAPVQRLRGAVERVGHSLSIDRGDFTAAVTIGDGQRAAGLGWAPNLQLSSDDAAAARVLAARVAARIAPDTQIGFALSQGASGLVAQLQGSSRPAFLVAPESLADSGLLESSDIAAATRFDLGAWGLTISAEQGRAWLGENRQASDVLFGVRERFPTSRLGVALDRSWEGLDASFALSWLSEERTLLGAHFNSAFDINGSNTMFADGRLSAPIATNWRIGAAYRGGFTRISGGDLIGEGPGIMTQAWSLDVTRRSTFVHGDSIGLRLSQPLRVQNGGIEFELPIAYDYASDSAILGQQYLSLSPEGREFMGELNWTGQLPIGTLGVSTYYRRQPGHYQSAPDDVGALISLNSHF